MINKYLLPALLTLSLVYAILALVPPPRSAEAQFVAQQTYAGASSGSANVQTIVIRNMTTLKPGVPMTFVPSFTNTGPTTLNVSSIGAVNVRRPSSIGLVSLSGGELQAGTLTTVMYDGVGINIVGPVDTRPIGDTMEYRGGALPPGYLVEDGSCVSTATYAALFVVIANDYGICSAGLFAIPDSRGTIFTALDNQGLRGAASRITSGGSGCNATVPTAYCGTQGTNITVSQMPSHVHAVFAGVETHTHDTVSLIGMAGISNNGGAQGFTSGGFSSSAITNGFSITAAATGLTVRDTAGGAGNANQTAIAGSGSLFPMLPPILLGRRAIKY